LQQVLANAFQLPDGALHPWRKRLTGSLRPKMLLQIIDQPQLCRQLQTGHRSAQFQCLLERECQANV
jgi:hypothetical protein